MGILGPGAVIVVGGRIGGGGFRVELDVLGIEARGVGKGDVETIEDAVLWCRRDRSERLRRWGVMMAW